MYMANTEFWLAENFNLQNFSLFFWLILFVSFGKRNFFWQHFFLWQTQNFLFWQNFFYVIEENFVPVYLWLRQWYFGLEPEMLQTHKQRHKRGEILYRYRINTYIIYALGMYVLSMMYWPLCMGCVDHGCVCVCDIWVRYIGQEV